MGVVAFVEHASRSRSSAAGCAASASSTTPENLSSTPHGQQGSRHRCAGRDARPGRASADQEDAAYELALGQAEHALSLPGVRGLHITDFRHDGAVSRLCRDLGIPTKEERRAHAHRAQLPV